VIAVPIAYFAPVRTSATSAERADLNGESRSVTTNSSPAITTRPAPDLVTALIKAIAVTSTSRAQSAAIITSRRGSRSARPDRPIPPRSQGRKVMA
jgi:hypothetical protein